ncbi:MAG: DUF1592 domain-containing protein, partial [Vicinamibacterales bacterium]
MALATMMFAQTPVRPGPIRTVVPVRNMPGAAPSVRPAPAAASVVPGPVPPTFATYCFDCHAGTMPEGNFNLENLLAQPSVGAHWEQWEKVADALETSRMPSPEALQFPSDAERKAAAAWVRSSLKAYEVAHAGDPGRVTVRRLTSGEYAYAIRDLTGIDIAVGIDPSSDSVGGEGFTNFGDVQFVEDASIERYLEAAKLVADHAVIGAGPLGFYADAGQTGLELSALSRITDMYAAKGFRVVSGEGGRPFGLDRYGKAFYVAWYYKHRVALGDATATLAGLAAKDGITARFAQHVWTVLNRTDTLYPVRETVDRWRSLPGPTRDVKAWLAKARAGTDDIYKQLTTWPSWFFARGDVAAGGAGDESPLMFDDKSLEAEPTHHYAYALGGRGARGGRGPAPGPSKVFLSFTNVNPSAGVKPVAIWRNPRIITRAAVAPAPVPATQPLRAVLSPAAASRLGFGTSPDGSTVGPDDFATQSTVSFEIDVPPSGNTLEFQADVELGQDKNAVIRLMVSDRDEGSSRDAAQRVILGEPQGPGYRTFRAGMAQYVELLPPNSQGEANPADKDPVPAPFDNTYNSAEHDAFVLKVKYQRNDRFFTENIVEGAGRARLNQAWNDLFGSWPYHDAYLGMLAEHYKLSLPSRQIKDFTPAMIAALPSEVRPHVRALRTHYDEVTRVQTLAQPGHVQKAIAFASQAWRRPLTPVEKTNLRGFYDHLRTVQRLDHEAALRALVARILVSPAFLYRVEADARGPEKPLTGYELASRLSFFLWSSIPDAELRRAAAAGELANPDLLAKQVKRMTVDPKARRLATEFFGQWLGFYHFNEYRGVDTGRFPEFTEEVKSAMYDEA